MAWDLTNAAVRLTGPFDFTYLNSQRCAKAVGQNCQIEFRFTGTAFTITYAVSSTATVLYERSIDGGAFSDLTMPSTTNTYEAEGVSGLSEATHSVVIRHKTGTTQDNAMFQVVNGIDVTGAAPAILAPSDDGGLYGTRRSAGRQMLLGYGRDNDSGGWARRELTRQDAAHCFTSDATEIKVYAFRNTAKLRLYQDGAAAASAVTLDSGNTYGWYSLGSSLSGTHEYQIVNVLNGQVCYIGMILAVGGTISATPPSARPNIIGYGHSKVASNVTGALATTDLGWLFQLGITKGYGVINQGVSARKVAGLTVSELSHNHEDPISSYTRRDLTDIPYVFVLAGHNDNGLANTNPTDFSWSMERWLRKLLEAHVGAQIYVLGELNTTAFSTAIRDAMNDAISDAVTAIGDASMDYINTDGWIDPATETSDGTHPNAAGTTAILAEINALGLLPAYSAPAAGGGLLRPMGMAGGLV